MRKLFFILLLGLLATAVYGQRHSFSTLERVTVEGITYNIDKSAISYKYKNIANTKFDAPYINLDGSPADGDSEQYDSGELDVVALRRVIREVFTQQELTDFKATNTRLTLSFVFDNKGVMLEAAFLFKATAPVVSLPVERIAQLEKRLKAEVTTNITDPATKNLQFIDGFYGYNFKYMDDK